MPNNRHTGERYNRHTRTVRRPKTRETYAIITDGQETEKQYLNGLRASIPEEIRPVLEVYSSVKAPKFLEKCRIIRNEDLFPDSGKKKIWILFDRDCVSGFDDIVRHATKEGYGVAWSNPCIEEWFWAHFDNFKSHTSSTETIDLFKELFGNKTGKAYRKNLPEIYELLIRYGDETKAIQRAEQRLAECGGADISNCSDMHSATTVHLLVKELKKL